MESMLIDGLNRYDIVNAEVSRDMWGRVWSDEGLDTRDIQF